MLHQWRIRLLILHPAVAPNNDYSGRTRFFDSLNECVQYFVANEDGFYIGTAEELCKSIPSGMILEELKAFSRKYIYRSHDAENIELSGYSAVYGLLNHFSVLLRMERKDFHSFLTSETKPKKGYDLEWRMVNLISRRCIRNYLFEIRKNRSDINEILQRAHLLLDYVAGMTDHFALNTYQMLEGIKIRI